MLNNPLVKAFILVASMFYWMLQIATMLVVGVICLIAGLINSVCIWIFRAHDYRLSLVSLWVLSGAVYLKLLGDHMGNLVIYKATNGEHTLNEIWDNCIDDFKKGLEDD